MGIFRVIWKHDVNQAGQIAKLLLDNKKVNLNWKIVLLPVFLYNVYHYRKDLRFTRKNFLFTKQLAFDAAKNILQGKEQAWEFRRIEIKTQEILDREKKGFYTEKIRRKQLSEIQLLIKHYLNLFESTTTHKEGGLDFTAIGGKRQGREVPQSLRVEPGAKHPVWKTQSKQTDYPALIRESYTSKENYLVFLSTLHKAEEDVIQAAITTLRRGTKKDRREWFQKVSQTTGEVRMALSACYRSSFRQDSLKTF